MNETLLLVNIAIFLLSFLMGLFCALDVCEKSQLKHVTETRFYVQKCQNKSQKQNYFIKKINFVSSVTRNLFQLGSSHN